MEVSLRWHHVSHIPFAENTMPGMEVACQKEAIRTQELPVNLEG